EERILRGKPSERTSVGREFSIGIVTRRRKTLHFTYTRNKTRNLRDQPRKFCRCCSRKFLLVEGRPGRGYHSGWGSYGSLGPLGSIVSTHDKASATIVAPSCRRALIPPRGKRTRPGKKTEPEAQHAYPP